MEFRILGPLEVLDGDRALDLGGPKPRALLAIMLLRAGEVVSDDLLIDELWGEAPPKSARHLVHVYVSNLRRASCPLVTRAPGYLLELAGDAIDARRFVRLLAEGRRLLAGGDPATAAHLLEEAGALWRGPALADFTYEPFAQAEIARLEELRIVAREELVEAGLALGRHAELVGEAGALVAEHPLRERPRGQLMLALYRCGRQAEALEAYRTGRELLVEELGIEPGPALQTLQQAILRQDETLQLQTNRPAPADAARKLVTVVVARAAPVDPEARRPSVQNATATLTNHGASVKRGFDGSVVAVFGVPEAHEDDALRAARAATEAGAELAIGIEAGEVLVEGGAVEGEAVARAVRLGQDARPGEVLIGEAAHGLVRHAVLTEPGGAGRRLVAVLPQAPALPSKDAPLVGREAELQALREAFEEAVRERTPRLVTVIGEAGVGKSRLAQELLAALGDEATALVGRCISYGEGITFWPLREMVRQAAGAETREALLELLAADEEREEVAALVASALGAGQVSGSREETFRAFRRVFAAAAGARPLVLVLEDIHWGEPTYLDFVEYLVTARRSAQLLIVCLARPELLEQRPGWGEGGVTLRLSRLSAAEARELVARTGLPAAAAERIVEAGEGNPFFLEQLVAMLAAGSQDELPPTVRAVLTARLDRLGPAERAVIERAAVVGREFGREAVEALLPDAARASLGRHLDALIRREYVRPEGPARLRFQHVLIQEAAYRTIPKSLRAELHIELADWLERELGARITGYQELVGYHLERAYQYGAELGAPDPMLAQRAGEHLWAAGRRASARVDVPASVNLYDRAVALLPDEPSGELLQEFGASLNRMLEHERAADILSQAVERAAAAGNERTELRARVDRWWSAPDGPTAEMEQAALSLIPRLEELDDDLGLTKAWQLIAYAFWREGRHAGQEDPLERALVHARRTGDRLEVSEILINLYQGFYRGPVPVEEGLRRSEEALADGDGGRLGQAAALTAGAGVLRAMLGRFDEGRELVLRSKAIYEDLAFWGYVPWRELWQVEMLAGDPVAAERWMREGQQAMPTSLAGLRAQQAASLAHALCAQGRHEEAERLTEVSEQAAGHPAAGAPLASGQTVRTRILWRSARAKALAHRGELEPAERMAREAVALGEGTDDLNLRADTLLDLAEVLRVAGGDAGPAVAQAVELYERKGNVVMARRARV